MRLYRVGIGLASGVWPCQGPRLVGHARGSVGGDLNVRDAAIAALKQGQQWMWFHCASVGEYEQARPVIEAWRSLHPGDAFLLSFYSASGWDAFTRRQPEWWTAADRATAMSFWPFQKHRARPSTVHVQAAGDARIAWCAAFCLRNTKFGQNSLVTTLQLAEARIPIRPLRRHMCCLKGGSFPRVGGHLRIAKAWRSHALQCLGARPLHRWSDPECDCECKRRSGG